MEKRKFKKQFEYILKVVEETGHMLICAALVMAIMGYNSHSEELINDSVECFICGVVIVIFCWGYKFKMNKH